MAIKTFQRGSAVYTCNSCKRATRNTGDEGNSRLCYECYELAGIDNEISDNGPLPTDDLMHPDNSWRTSPAYVIELLTTLRKKHNVDIIDAWGDTEVGRAFIDQVAQ